MKIFIPFHTRDIGGPSIFVKKFEEGMKQRGHPVVFDESEDHDILFLIVQAPFDILIRAKKKKKIIVQRLDGVYYWSVASWKYPLLNIKARLIHHFFTDYTIYQSQYSKKCVTRFFGRKDTESAIIYNGVDTEIFNPLGDTAHLRDFPEQKIFFTASEFRRRDQIVPILDAFTHYAEHSEATFKLVVAGSFSRELLGFEDELKKYTWVYYLGKIDNALLPYYERSADVFVFTHLNPPCPNNIIEAMACGLPICGVADGAMPELVKHEKNGYLLPIHGDAYWRQRSYDTERFAYNLSKTITHKENMSKKSRIIAVSQYSLENMLNRYEYVLTSLLKKI